MNITERQAASLVREFLDCSNLADTLTAFKTEYTARGHTFLPLASSKATVTSADVKAALLKHFNRGERGQFFNLWDTHIPDGTRNGPDAMRLEFYTSIHFAIFPANKHVEQGVTKLPISSTLDTFKAFLETRGSQLSQTAEFLPYYALPYMPDPSSHPTFAALFTKDWLTDLRTRLTAFIDTNVHVHVPSRLSDMIVSMEELKAKDIRLLKRHQVLQADYHNLLAVASELIGALANSLNGQRISQEYVAGVLERMQGLRKSSSASANGRGGVSQQGGGAGGGGQQFGPKYLNYESIKSVLASHEGGANGARTKVVLLHALRQRAIHQPTAQQQRLVIKTYIDYDLLHFHSTSHQPLLDLFTNSHHPALKDQAAKFANLLCSYHVGRAYFTHQHEPAFLKTVIAALKTADRPTTHHHCLGVLEKLSLRRSVQSHLIRHADMIQYLAVTVLADAQDQLADATVVYAVALLLNLCQRTAGKKRIAREAERGKLLDVVLKQLAGLLEHAEPLVKSYVHGIMYTLTDVPVIAERAKEMGMPEMIGYIRESMAKGGAGMQDDVLVRQMDRLLVKFRQGGDTGAWDADALAGSDDEDVDDDGEEEVEECDTGEESDAAVELGGEADAGDEALGEEFLRQFAAPDSRSQGKLVPAKPVAKQPQPTQDTSTNVMDQLRRQVSDARAAAAASSSRPTSAGRLPTPPMGGSMGGGGITATSQSPPATTRRPSSAARTSSPLARPPSAGPRDPTESPLTRSRAVKVSQPGGMVGSSTINTRDEHSTSPLPPPRLKDGRELGSQELAEYTGAFSTHTKLARTPPTSST